MKQPTKLKTVYSNYQSGHKKTNSSRHLNPSIGTAVAHLQTNHYDADYAEILDADTEKLYAHIKRYRFDEDGFKAGDIHIMYKWNPQKTADAKWLPKKKIKFVK